MIEEKDLDAEYYKGILYACEYFRDELGIEDAMDTTIATEAVEFLNEEADEDADWPES